jgi:hypothetical protein
MSRLILLILIFEISVGISWAYIASVLEYELCLRIQSLDAGLVRPVLRGMRREVGRTV